MHYSRGVDSWVVVATGFAMTECFSSSHIQKDLKGCYWHNTWGTSYIADVSIMGRNPLSKRVSHRGGTISPVKAKNFHFYSDSYFFSFLFFSFPTFIHCSTKDILPLRNFTALSELL